MELLLKNEDLKTLSQCINSLKRHGFEKDFKVEGEMLHTIEGDDSFSPDQVKILNFYRFEGDSDPGDMSILYAIETSNGTKGTLVDAFGTYSNKKISDFILQVNDINKNTNRDETHVSVGK